MESTQIATGLNGYFVIEPRGAWKTAEPVSVEALNKAGFEVNQKLHSTDMTLSLNGNYVADLFTTPSAADQFAALYAPNARPVPGAVMLGWWYV